MKNSGILIEKPKMADAMERGTTSQIYTDFDKLNIPIWGLFQLDLDNNKWLWSLEPSGTYTISSLRIAYDDFFLQGSRGLKFF